MSKAISIVVDTTRGADVFRGSKLLAHFEGPSCYAQAKSCAAEGPGRWVRYWGVKPQEEGE